MNRCSLGLRECKCYFRPLKAKSPLTIGYRMSVLAVYSLVLAQPGPIFGRSDAKINVATTSADVTEKAEP